MLDQLSYTINREYEYTKVTKRDRIVFPDIDVTVLVTYEIFSWKDFDPYTAALQALQIAFPDGVFTYENMAKNVDAFVEKLPEGYSYIVRPITDLDIYITSLGEDSAVTIY